MAITRPVTLSYALIGDGVSTSAVIDLGPQIAQQGLPAGATPSVVVSLSVNDGSEVSGAVSGQQITLTFGEAPANLAAKTVVMTLGF